MVHEYRDKNGKHVLTVRSSMPGFTFVPPGFNYRDAQPITPKDWDDLQEKVKEENKNYKDPLQVRLDAMEAELKALRASSPNGTAPAGP